MFLTLDDIDSEHNTKISNALWYNLLILPLNRWQYSFYSVPSMALNLAVKVRYGGAYQPTISEAQVIRREARSGESMQPNRDLKNKNLISRLHKRIRLHNKLKSKRYA